MYKQLIFVLCSLTFVHLNGLEYCESPKVCGHDEDVQNLLFYDINPPEGFNLRRDVYMRFAIMLSEAHKNGKKFKWKLVLPPWYKLYHWKSDLPDSKPKPWNLYFDVDSLKSYAPVLELNEVFSVMKSNVLDLDRLYVLQNYEDAFEDGVFREKWEVSSRKCYYNTDFWGYRNITVKEIVCIYFQGKASKLWEILSLHPQDKRVMFAHGEIVLHDDYGTKNYWDCRKSMKFNKELIIIAEKYIRENFDCTIQKCSNYASIHLRRQDFTRSRKKDVPSITNVATQLEKYLKKFNASIKHIFVATDGSTSETIQLESKLKKLGFTVHYFTPRNIEIMKYSDGGIAIIDQIICSHSAYFIGTHESTFTFRIQEEREILGFPSFTTFNRFCPDSGRCEKPSKWTIVN